MSVELSVSSTLIFFVNGKKVVEKNPNPEWTLLHYLRKNLGLSGTKLGCAEGGCGACTIMVSKYSRADDKVIHLAVNACLAPVCSMHGLAVTTVEGIGSTKTRLHPVQERIAKAHGSQCGFCTPGIVMSMYALLRNMPKPSYNDLEVAFQGNLCRCTGYRPIIEGYKTFTEEWEHQQAITIVNNGVCSLGEKCCKNGGSGIIAEVPQQTFDTNSFVPYDASQEPIFPPELKLTSLYDNEQLLFKSTNVTWYRPQNLEDLLKFKQQYKDAKIIIGNTEVGIEVKFKNSFYPVMIMADRVPELCAVNVLEEGLTIGAALTLTYIENIMNNLVKTLPQHKTRIFKAIIDMLNWFSGKQVRNVASVGGNIMTGSPISDLNPIFLAAGAVLKFKSSHHERNILMDHTFFTDYRKNKSAPDEVLVSIHIPFTKEWQYFKAYKQSKRRNDDIAVVNMALNVEMNPNDSTIKSMNIAFGGIAPVTVMVIKSSQLSIGQQWDENMIEEIFDNLVNELPLSPSAPGGMVQYRRSLTLSLFFKIFLEIAEDLQEKVTGLKKISENDKSGIGGLKCKAIKYSQYFNIPSEHQSKVDPVGRPTIHASALNHATGEATYCDDMPPIEGELYLALVLSTKSHANVLSIDASEALSIPGVRAFFSADDIDENKNKVGQIVRDEEIFISKKVSSQGQVLGAIVAESQIIAQQAAKRVKVVYEELKPVIISIKDAIREKSFHPGSPMELIRGDVEFAFETADFTIENEFYVGGQEHFYLETHATRVVPKKEDNELEIFASYQHPSEINKLIGHILDIPINRIVSRVKRIGGGFGGKEARFLMVCIPVVIAAHKLQTPVRCMLDRDEDMMITGGRHPFYFKYKIAFMKNGKIVGAIIEMYCNAGYSVDVSPAVLERAIMHCENAYFIPNMKITGYMCKTNTRSNTVFRGSGGPQGMLLAENYLRQIALKLGKAYHEVARNNLYVEGQATHYKQILTHCTLARCWDECLQKSDYEKRRVIVREYNRQNHWKKRGITIVPTKFGVAFTLKCLNQAGALVHVYLDGSVLLSHGGIEMGQGLHTKMIQVASRVLQIDSSKIFISDTSSDKVPNTSPTAASVSSDLNGMAVINACNQIMERLEPIIKNNPDKKWEDWVSKAYLECISLSAVGHYAITDLGYDIYKNEGLAYNYFTYGVACSEVEIDCLTGDHQVLRTDIVMDIGESLNPAIDVGQIEGAFVQGYGLYTLEELMYSPEGTLYTRGPGTYKIPGFADIPGEFNVSLLKGAPNPRAIYSSKAVGEPPLFLASSVFFAIKEAITTARIEREMTADFKFDSPATAARIRMACEDHITKRFQEPEEGSYKPWNVVP